MLAAHATATGGDDPVANLEVGDRPRPEPPAGWALVRMEAASLNHHDLWALRGISSPPISLPRILGTDCAGIVEAYGPDAPEGVPAPGTPVVVHAVVTCGACAACRGGDTLACRRFRLLSDAELEGTLAEYVVAPAVNLLPRPEGLGAVAAACLPTAYLTAYRMLFTRAAVRPGATVLVQGASGGVATAAMLLARAAGIAVIATSRDEDKRALALELGAIAALAPTREAAREITERTGGGVDAVLDTVGEATWELSLRAVRHGGAVVVSGATSGDAPPAQLRRIFWRQLSILGSTMGTRAELERVVALAGRGALRPLVDRTLPLRDAGEAFRHLAAGEQRGKIVLVAA